MQLIYYAVLKVNRVPSQLKKWNYSKFEWSFPTSFLQTDTEDQVNGILETGAEKYSNLEHLV